MVALFSVEVLNILYLALNLSALCLLNDVYFANTDVCLLMSQACRFTNGFSFTNGLPMLKRWFERHRLAGS